MLKSKSILLKMTHILPNKVLTRIHIHKTLSHHSSATHSFNPREHLVLDSRQNLRQTLVFYILRNQFSYLSMWIEIKQKVFLL